MKNLKNINLGLCDEAIEYLHKNSQDIEILENLIQNLIHCPEKHVYSRTGYNNSIKLHQFKLKDGSLATEFLQFDHVNKYGQIVYFMGLRTKYKTFVWKQKEINYKLNDKIFS